jgi:hypothetical protein
LKTQEKKSSHEMKLEYCMNGVSEAARVYFAYTGTREQSVALEKKQHESTAIEMHRK